MVTGSRELIREMNRRLVLETVINDGPLSRAAISKKLGLTKATISAIVQDLLEEQYIEEIGSDQTQYGRKPILLRFCRQNGYIIALDLGVERTVLMVCDLLGQNCRLHQYNCPLERDTSIDFLLQLIRNQIRLLPATPFGVVGIGIGIHGTVCRNEITFTPNYNLADLPIKDTLEDALMKRFKVTKACNGCGICAAVCPMGNIRIQDKKAVHGHVCAACYACLHWCPKHATLLRVPFLTHRPQHHHPEVTVSSMKNPSSLVI